MHQSFLGMQYNTMNSKQDLYRPIVQLAVCEYLYWKPEELTEDPTDNAVPCELECLSKEQLGSLIPIICQKLELNISAEDAEMLMTPRIDSGSLSQLSMSDMGMASKIASVYGKAASDLYEFSYSLLRLTGITAYAGTLTAIKKGLTKKKYTPAYLTGLQRRLKKLFTQGEYVFKPNDMFTLFFDKLFTDQVNLVEKMLSCHTDRSLSFMQNFHSQLLPLTQSIFRDLQYINHPMQEGKAIINTLKNIKPGSESWRDYEVLCIRAVRFLFIPSLGPIQVQKPTRDRHERRDITIVNTGNTKFWKEIKIQFDSNHIVVECKNSISPDKNDLNQLRIYLSKPSIGRAGLLFIRDKSSNNLSLAQTYAYMQHRILVLIIDDQLLEKMIFSKALFNDCDNILTNEKNQFEVDM